MSEIVGNIRANDPQVDGERRAAALPSETETGRFRAEIRLSRAERADLAAALDPAVLLEASGITPDPWQRAFVRSRATRRLLVAPRQAGKSTAVAGLALWTALYRGPGDVLLVSPAQRQSQHLLRRVLALYRACGTPITLDGESATGLGLANGSRIVSLPASEASIRGFSPALIVVDEAARVPDRVFHALEPSTSASNGTFCAISTPSGRRGWFYGLWEESTWEKTHVRPGDCPRLTEERLVEGRRLLGERAWREEYGAEFLEAEEDARYPRFLADASVLDVVFGGAE